LKGEAIPEAITRIANSEIGFALHPKQGSVNGQLGVWEHHYEDNFAGADGVPTHYVVLPFHFLLRPLQVAAIHADNDREDQHGELHWWDKQEILDSAAVHPNCKVYFEQEGLLP
jgi:colanic acid biosynthesis protein WcaH